MIILYNVTTTLTQEVSNIKIIHTHNTCQIHYIDQRSDDRSSYYDNKIIIIQEKKNNLPDDYENYVDV